MFLSKYLLPLLKQNPKDAIVASHRLMIRCGLINKLGSGIYSWLPMGFRVLSKVTAIIRKELDAIGCLEINTPSMQPVEMWEKSGRYGDGGELAEETLVAIDRHGHKLIYSPTAEEVFTQLFADSVQSYKALPITLYQITNKFRDEIRPRFGLMRGREFVMKDAYSFDIDEKNSLLTYEKIMKAYLQIFTKCGLQAIPVLAPTGSIGGNYSHEFHVIAGTGESVIYYDSAIVGPLSSDNFSLEDLDSYYVREQEMHNIHDGSEIKGELIESRSIELGHIFHLGEKYSKAMGVRVQDPDGNLIHPSMGCYGIGVSRLVCSIIEALHDSKGIVWPVSVAPFQVIIINLAVGDTECDAASFGIYEQLISSGLEVIYDDTSDGAGSKFARADLIGIPLQVIVGPRVLKEGKIELRVRRSGAEIMVDSRDIVEKVKVQLAAC